MTARSRVVFDVAYDITDGQVLAIPLLPFVEDDGGRAAAGFVGRAGDCVARSIAIAARLPYRTVYDELARRSAAAGGTRSARDGVRPKVYKAFLADMGWRWVPTMGIGTGCTTHLRAGELPAGRIIARCSGHLVAVINGVLHDTHDSSREGTRCVYGYWSEPNDDKGANKQ